MIQICICLLLPFTSVLSYPSINQNSDQFDLPDEFWSHHFGSDFKDAVHFHIEQPDFTNAGADGNTLQKHHLPENKNNENYERSTYVLHTPQLVTQPNRTFENYLKVQILSPGEIEALERGMKQKEMYKSPVVATLPDFSSITSSKSFNHAPSNTPTTAVYRSNQNRVYPQFFQNNNNIWPQTQHYTYDPKMVYQQFAKPALMEKAMQPSYEKILMKSLNPSYENKMNSPLDQILQPPSQEKKMEILLQPSFEKIVESSIEQPFYEHQQEHLKVKANEPLYGKSMQPSIDKMAPAVDIIQPSTDKMQPLVDQITPSNDKIQSSNDKIQSSNDEIQSSNDKVQPSIDEIQSSNDHQIKPFNDQMHQQPSTEQMQALNEMIRSSHKAILPSYKKVLATFEKIPVSYPKMNHHMRMYEEVSSSNNQPQPIDELKEQNPYEEIRHLQQQQQQQQHHQPQHEHSSFHKNRMMSYDKTASSDLSRQSLNIENLRRTFENGLLLDDVRDAKHEYRSEKKTST